MGGAEVGPATSGLSVLEELEDYEEEDDYEQREEEYDNMRQRVLDSYELDDEDEYEEGESNYPNYPAPGTSHMGDLFYTTNDLEGDEEGTEEDDADIDDETE